MTRFAILLLLVLALGSCRGQKHSSADSGEATLMAGTDDGGTDIAPPPPPPDGMPPNACLIVARILQIHPVGAGDHSKENCASHPCMATVTLEEVNACGMAISNRPSPQRSVDVYFKSSLDPTNFGGLALPGLKEGQRFRAMFTLKQELASADGASQYTYEVGSYQHLP